MSDSVQTQPPRRSVLRKCFNANTLGAVLLLGAVAVSMYRVCRIHQELFDPDVTIIRICHWQLESGYRDAMQAVINEYQDYQLKHGHKVRVLQMAVTEKLYAQRLNTQLISGDAPDLAELGGQTQDMASSDQYTIRYFLPLTDRSEEPNPYDQGTPLEGKPWRETFIDGMRGGYNSNLQDYYVVPTSLLGNVRIFYNKQMLQDATGSSEPPKTLGQLLKVCQAIRELGHKRGEELIPIAGGQYNEGMLTAQYGVAFMANLEPDLDVSLSGDISGNDTYIGFRTGKWSFQSPAIRAYFECLKKLCEQFPVGFMAMDRQQAAFLFVQQKAGMMASGAWDVKSLAKQAKFDIGIMDFPLPGPGEQWSQYVVGRRNEAKSSGQNGSMGASGFAVYKYSRNQEQAIDFLQFLSSVKYNQMLNQLANWPPIILCTIPSSEVKPFMPDPNGFTSQLGFAYGGGSRTAQVYNGQLWRFLSGEISYESFTRQVEAALLDPVSGGDRTWAMDYDGAATDVRRQELNLAALSLRLLMDPQAKDVHRKYQFALLRQVGCNNGEGTRYRYELVRHQKIQER